MTIVPITSKELDAVEVSWFSALCSDDFQYLGYHYYMTPETAEIGLTKFEEAITKKPKIWSYLDYPDLTKLKVFNNG